MFKVHQKSVAACYKLVCRETNWYRAPTANEMSGRVRVERSSSDTKVLRYSESVMTCCSRLELRYSMTREDIVV